MSITRTRRSREVAFLVLYQLLFAPQQYDISSICDEEGVHDQIMYLLWYVAEKNNTEAYDRDYLMAIFGALGGVYASFPARVDAHVETFAFADMDVVDRALILLGYLEATVLGHDPKLCLNEMIELAKMYGDDASYKLVNGILHALIGTAGENDETSTAGSESEETAQEAE